MQKPPWGKTNFARGQSWVRKKVIWRRNEFSWHTPTHLEMMTMAGKQSNNAFKAYIKFTTLRNWTTMIYEGTWNLHLIYFANQLAQSADAVLRSYTTLGKSSLSSLFRETDRQTRAKSHHQRLAAVQSQPTRLTLNSPMSFSFVANYSMKPPTSRLAREESNSNEKYYLNPVAWMLTTVRQTDRQWAPLECIFKGLLVKPTIEMPATCLSNVRVNVAKLILANFLSLHAQSQGTCHLPPCGRSKRTSRRRPQSWSTERKWWRWKRRVGEQRSALHEDSCMHLDIKVKKVSWDDCAFQVDYLPHLLQ